MDGDLGLESDSPGQILALPFTLSLSFPICKAGHTRAYTAGLFGG